MTNIACRLNAENANQMQTIKRRIEKWHTMHG